MAVRVIVDTDIDTDCDDVGALAELHSLARTGEAEVLGVVCSVPYANTARCVRAINTYYGRREIPVGLLQDEELETAERYSEYREHLDWFRTAELHRFNDAIAAEFDSGYEGPGEFEDAVPFYRRLLAAQPDGSVVIVAIGFLTALAKLLQSPPDAQSPLSGRELVTTKVSRLVTMGVGSFPAGRDQFNWVMDRESAAIVLNEWPTPIVVSEWGTTVLTGAGLASLETRSPVRRAYETFLGGEGRSRSSWDQLAVLYAVRGAGDRFEEVTGRRIRFDAASGTHEWVEPDAGEPGHVYLKQTASDEELARIVEDLMTRLP